MYSSVKRTPTSNIKAQGVLYEGKRGSHSITIWQNFDDKNVHSFKMCEDHKSIYLLTSLESFPLKERHFFVYKKYTSLLNGCKTKEMLSEMVDLLISLYIFYGELNMSFFLNILMLRSLE